MLEDIEDVKKKAEYMHKICEKFVGENLKFKDLPDDEATDIIKFILMSVLSMPELLKDFADKHNNLAAVVVKVNDVLKEHDESIVKTENIKNEVDALNKYIDSLMG